MGLVRTLKEGDSIHLIPLDAQELWEIITITNVRNGDHRPEVKLNLTAPQQYHIAPQEHVDSVGGLANYFNLGAWRVKQNGD